MNKLIAEILLSPPSYAHRRLKILTATRTSLSHKLHRRDLPLTVVHRRRFSSLSRCSPRQILAHREGDHGHSQQHRRICHHRQDAPDEAHRRGSFMSVTPPPKFQIWSDGRAWAGWAWIGP
ncbi:hypothetical protein L1049_015564 [Liquidambar formosana]|uniref:Uncharacterized protein n=1 Tax=Liquidambar formosana TaxID=63359 RepID=A0AAP0X680_LIQFO